MKKLKKFFKRLFCRHYYKHSQVLEVFHHKDQELQTLMVNCTRCNYTRLKTHPSWEKMAQKNKE